MDNQKDTKHLQHELEIHQHELAEQNRELREKQLELEQTKQAYQELFDQAPSPYITFNEKGVIRNLNLEAARFLKSDRKLLANKPFIVFLKPQSHRRFFSHIASVFQAEEPQVITVNIEDKMGNRHWINMRSRTVQTMAGEMACFSILEDITRQHELQEEMESAKAEAQEANEAKNQFLANMSHEIRTPMNGIMGMIELFKTTEFSDEQGTYLEAMENSTYSLLTIINDILDLSRIESGKIEIDIERFSLRRELETTRAFFEPMAQKKDLDLSLVVDDDIPDKLEADSGRIKQVLMNLLSNAVKFTNTGGIRILAGMEDEAENDFILSITVQDSGIGMSENQRERIFERFTQIDAGYTKEFQGTGLGLAISKQLIELMGGTITVSGKINEGSSFTFTVPVRKASEQAPEENPERELEQTADCSSPVSEIFNRPPRILIAEDNAVNLLYIQAMLTQEGFEIASANNGKEVIKLLEQNPFDLVLMDITMPELSGKEATNIIRNTQKENFPSDIPIIAMTGHSMKDDRQALLQHGMNDYISKPFTKDEVISTMKKHLLACADKDTRSGHE
ncbi:MAG: response regulator [Spirochaetales bacterium]|nr:response regulator [Spirochaetales bacterium]MCF7938481.1 response regulator [Spirochaetales bacterium]